MQPWYTRYRQLSYMSQITNIRYGEILKLASLIDSFHR